MTNLTAGFLLTELKKCAKPDKAAFLPSFFQCLPGGYGEGDQFLGVIVPDQRQTAKAFRTMPLRQVDEVQLVRFLEQYAKKMPRTMLRYAIEKLSKEERVKFMER